ncbi:MAG: alanine--tRNA ligase [Elusimicrobia bacterium RIFOXYC2_FULL_34_12]|nr:MAG: alanine--tRNA ligase [Elusimicrobia bacterium RIFOXYC2_FULL_34_12]
MTLNDIRKSFIKYFESKNHKIFPSDSLVPSSDPTLLFTSAGMVQFKNYFLGKQKIEGKYQRAASIQKCFRTSDIENIGHTARHLTFFEMLGNFSFGDYFKKEAIEWSWEFLTEVLKINKEKLYVSVYKDDDEACDIWQKIISKDRIIKLGNDSNFWQMGETGPCGPCSEILYDTGIGNGCGKSICGPGCDCDRYLEVWNLVFTQFDRQSDSSLKNLPQKNIDTGMGLERLATVIQNAKSNFETDEFSRIINYIKNIAEIQNETSIRIIADHSRAITFLISDGILPSNEGRGYVLRRILRRALTHGKKLKFAKPFLYKVCGEVIEAMKEAYPDLNANREHISRVVKMEEEKFLQTLERGLEILEDLKKNKEEISGKDVFVLYDTYGFPFDLTKELLKESGISIDEKVFENEMEKQKERSKKAWKGSGDIDMSNYFEFQKKLGNTVFKGYEETRLITEILAILKDGKIIDNASEGDEVEIVLKETPFYGESGGQIGDKGKLKVKSEKLKLEIEAEVIDTQKPVENFIVHKAKVTKGVLKTGDTVDAEVDEERRKNIMRNHTATHLLHKALRKIIGTHIVQRGSLVTNERFRFDFSQPVQLKREELDLVEQYVNKRIVGNLTVNTKITTINEAKNMGAMALFGEKYGEKVRCVITGDEKSPESIELCGGTHCKSTGEIGQFIIISEGSIGSGLRRIEALTGLSAYKFAKTQRETISEIAETLKASESEIVIKIQKLIEDKKRLEKEVIKAKTSQISEKDLLKGIKEINGMQLLSIKVDASSVDELRTLIDNLRNKIKSGIVVVGSVINEKPTVIVSVTNDLTQKYDARVIIKEISKIIGGGGGGKIDMAQAGGKDISKLDEALESIEKIIG